MLDSSSNNRQVLEKIGGASRDRTDDLIVANDALSQLSYSPECRLDFRLARLFYQRSEIDTISLRNVLSPSTRQIILTKPLLLRLTKQNTWLRTHSSGAAGMAWRTRSPLRDGDSILCFSN